MTTLQATKEDSMKKVLIIAAGVLVAVAAGAYKNEQNGFRGHVWGSPLPQGWGQPVAHEDTAGGVDYYAAPRFSEDNAIGCAKPIIVKYGFWHNKLMMVVITSKGSNNFLCLLSALNEKFGDGDQENEYTKKYTWAGRMTDISLDYNEVGDEVSLDMSSVAVFKELQAWVKEQAKKGAKQF